MQARLEVREARWAEDIPAVRMLLRNYAAHLAATRHGSVGICIEGFADELNALPAPYDSEGHALLVAELDGRLLGCVAVHSRQLANEGVCELKRLWTKPEARGQGLGRALVSAAIAWSQRKGAAAVVLDTHPGAMPEAGALYRSFGFREIERYNANPVPDIAFFRLDLREQMPVR